MKIIIENFGPINKFSYDLNKDFIVTYGDNNIGKSYAMQVVYILLKTLIDCMSGGNREANIYFKFSGFIRSDGINDEIEKMISEFAKGEEMKKDITEKISMLFYARLADYIMPSFLNSCQGTFGNFEKCLKQEPKIKVEFGEFKFTIDLQKKKIEGTLVFDGPLILKKAKSDFHKSRKNGSGVDIYVYKSEIDSPAMLINQKLASAFKLFRDKLTAKYSYVYFLPASRSGIYSGMNAFGSIVAELSKNRAFLTKKIELPGISEPISDYFINLSNIKTTNVRFKSNEKYANCYSEIEDKILKGKVEFDKAKNTLVYKPNNVDSTFEMTEVSSMVSEISPIVAFLKFILESSQRGFDIIHRKKRKAVLFIEEPEAHLHPQNQVALVEIFSQLISLGVKLIMSSHSNYVFNKLNNLVLSGNLAHEKYQPIVLEMKEKGSISRCLEIDELGANDENFIDVSEALYNERQSIIEKYNNMGE